jgi:thioredoxin-like negative regulator of GroEL
MARTVSMMAEEAEYAGAVTFGKCNLQSMPAAFARQHGIRDLPTIQAFRSGTVVGQIKRVDPNGLRKMVGEQMRAKAKA